MTVYKGNELNKILNFVSGFIKISNHKRNIFLTSSTVKIFE